MLHAAMSQLPPKRTSSHNARGIPLCRYSASVTAPTAPPHSPSALLVLSETPCLTYTPACKSSKRDGNAPTGSYDPAHQRARRSKAAHVTDTRSHPGALRACGASEPAAPTGALLRVATFVLHAATRGSRTMLDASDCGFNSPGGRVTASSASGMMAACRRPRWGSRTGAGGCTAAAVAFKPTAQTRSTDRPPRYQPFSSFLRTAACLTTSAASHVNTGREPSWTHFHASATTLSLRARAACSTPQSICSSKVTQTRKH